MHQPVRDHLETYLSHTRGNSNERSVPQEFHAHMVSCRSCADEVRLLADQSRLLLASHSAEQLEPQPGFYARVMDRIERQRRPDSFWTIFQEPAFGKRLTYACTALLLVLGTYLVSSEAGDQSVAPAVAVAPVQPYSGPDGTVQPKDRDAVLVNLASFHE